ncbi:MAG: hypothetical protein HY243_18450 [Proteobacteria bacterium]|nr:hypothetical protein [Pseudomonadota bacterium]
MDSYRTTLATAGIGAALVAICCAAPLLAVTFGAIGAIAWMVKAAYLLVPALLILLALIAVGLYRRRTTAQECCEPAALDRVERDE